MSGGYSEPLETETRRPQGSGELPREVGVLDQGTCRNAHVRSGAQSEQQGLGNSKDLEPPHILPGR